MSLSTPVVDAQSDVSEVSRRVCLVSAPLVRDLVLRDFCSKVIADWNSTRAGVNNIWLESSDVCPQDEFSGENSQVVSMLESVNFGSNPTHGLQKFFILWTAERMGITHEQSRIRVERALGNERRSDEAAKKLGIAKFPVIWNNMMQVYYDQDELAHFPGNYQIGEEYWLLRMLNNGHGIKHLTSLARAVATVAEENQDDRICIVDYGCGLATASNQLTFALRYLIGNTLPVDLYLIDTFRPATSNFAMCLCSSMGRGECKYLVVTDPVTLPKMPSNIHLLFAEEVLEHVPSPVASLNAFASKLVQGGMMKANMLDHDGSEQGHLTSTFTHVRAHAEKLGFICMKEFGCIGNGNGVFQLRK